MVWDHITILSHAWTDILLRSTKSFRENLAYSMAVSGRDSRNHSQLLREADIRKVYVYKFGKTALVEENAFNKIHCSSQGSQKAQGNLKNNLYSQLSLRRREAVFPGRTFGQSRENKVWKEAT